MTDQISPLGEGWDLHAAEWIAWSMTPAWTSKRKASR
jgi:hypothetical protein